MADVPTFQNIGPLWVFKDALALTENTTCMAVASPVLKTAIDGNADGRARRRKRAKKARLRQCKSM